MSIISIISLINILVTGKAKNNLATEMGLTWGEAQHVAQDRSRWRKTVAALCPTGDEED